MTLTGRFVRLEPLAAGHLDALEPITREPTLWTWFTTRLNERAALEAYVTDALAAERAGSALPFVTLLEGTREVIGSTRFMNISASDGRLEIGSTWLAPAHQRTPANTDAKYLMLRHAFDTLGATRVELKTHALNAKSRAAIERIGAQFEGIHRKHMLQPDGSRRDTAWYSILDDEWPAVKARLESMLG
ncbi:MAG: GNAT family N-acetyltransferase [Gemmatimonadales bacterium]